MRRSPRTPTRREARACVVRAATVARQRAADPGGRRCRCPRSDRDSCSLRAPSRGFPRAILMGAMPSPGRRLDPSLLRLVLITDGRGDPVRVERIVTAVVEAGVRCVQLREPQWSARALLRACERLQPVLAAHGALLLVNDRADVAATGA